MEVIYLNEQISAVDIDGVIIYNNVVLDYVGDEEEVYIPDTCTAIAIAAFYHKKIKRVVIGKSVTVIDAFSFAECSMLEEIKISKYCRYIHPSAFDSCPNLRYIRVSPENSYYYEQDGILFKDNMLVKYPTGQVMRDYDVPKHIAIIGDKAFNRVRGEGTFNIGKNVSVIGNKAFSYLSGIDVFVLPKGIIHIDPSAFSNAKIIAFVSQNDMFTAPDGVLLKGENYLLQYPLKKIETTVQLPSKVKSISDKAFNGSLYVEEFIPNSFFGMKDGVLYNLNFTQLIAFPAGRKQMLFRVPDSVMTFREGAFFGANIKELYLNDSIEAIEKHSFSESTICNFHFGKKLHTLGWSSFSNNSEVKLLDFSSTALAYVEGATFFGCSRLEKILFPYTLKEIDRWAFDDCTQLKRISLCMGNPFPGKPFFESGATFSLSYASVCKMLQRIKMLNGL